MRILQMVKHWLDCILLHIQTEKVKDSLMVINDREKAVWMGGKGLFANKASIEDQTVYYLWYEGYQIGTHRY